MKKRHERLYLADMLDSINAIETYIAGVSFEEFCGDPMRQDAVVRRMEIIGEASRHLSRELIRRHPGMPWPDIIGMRHKLTHDYFDVQLRIVWDTARKSLPPLKAWLVEVLKAEPPAET